MNWTSILSLEQRAVFSRLTCVIPFHNDGVTRERNLTAVVGYLLSLGCAVTVSEAGIEPSASRLLARYGQNVRIEFERTGKRLFHNTRARNRAALTVKTDLIALWDADIVIPYRQLYAVALPLLCGDYDYGYPYDGRFVDFEGHADFNGLSEPMQHVAFSDKQISVSQHGDGMTSVCVADQHLLGCTVNTSSLGGAGLFVRDLFVAGGMENERLVSYGPEDQERHCRFMKLGFVSCRAAGLLYHLSHPRGVNSDDDHELSKSNWAEFRRVDSVLAEDLWAEVRNWN